MAVGSPPRSWLWRRRRALWLVALLTAAAASGSLYVLATGELPEPAPLAETTILTDVDGNRLASIDSGEDRVPVPLSRVPTMVVRAVLASEDRNFYSHGGIDPVGVLRAAVADLRGRPLQGGSTITQQYVKQVYLGSERTIARKLREAAFALKAERRWGKDEILERYLNTVYFGRGAYGVQAASRAYFRTDVEELTLSQAAYLAGLIRAPNIADVDSDRDLATSRRDRTLRAMREEGWISAEQERRARGEPIETVVVGAEREPDIVLTEKGTSYFVEYVRAELVRRYGTDTTYQGGLRVKTSLDLDLQALAYDAVYGYLDQPGSDPSGALVSIDEGGRVVAMVGGRDFTASKVNYAVGRAGGGSGRQPGSTFKPFLLAAAVDEGYSLLSAFPAPAKVVLPRADQGDDYEVENYEGEDFGRPLNLVDATASSVNTVYVQAQEALGREKVAEMARRLGVHAPVPAVASTVLGTAEVSPLDMASAYSTFARRGVRIEPRVILEVRRADGTVLEPERDAPSERVLSSEEADAVNHCLRQVVLRGSGRRARLETVQVAGKTGTTQNFGDAWFVGFTPKLTTAVWVGFPEGSKRPLRDVRGDAAVSGGELPAIVFNRFMQPATSDARFQQPFPRVARLRGRTLAPPEGVVLATTTTTSTTTAPPPSTAPPAPTTTVAVPTTVPPPSTSTVPSTSTAPAAES
ncbi:MAG TPA: transglycosylase domain-containing protein [Acidimicrobiales bacterium]|nr:transglycosylase domain-containing protein [Acidimicrobiales bacterium]